MFVSWNKKKKEGKDSPVPLIKRRISNKSQYEARSEIVLVKVHTIVVIKQPSQNLSGKMVQALAIPLGYLTEPEDRTLLLKALDTLVAGW